MSYLLSVLLVIFSLFTVSCSSKSVTTNPQNYKDLDAEKAVKKARNTSEQNRIDNIYVAGSYGNTMEYMAALDGDRIVYIETDKSKFQHQDDEYNYIYFGNIGFDVDIGIASAYNCGYVLDTSDLKSMPKMPSNRGFGSDEGSKGCDSVFTSTNIGEELLARTIPAIGTFGIALLFMGTGNIQRFDMEYFQDRVMDSNLDFLRQELVEKSLAERAFAGSREIAFYLDANDSDSASSRNDGDSGTYEVVYIDEYDIENMDIKASENYAGILFVGTKNATVYGAYYYADFKSNNYSRAISQIITNPYSSIAKDKNIFLNLDTIHSMIPPEVPQPVIPAPNKLSKSEFEKQSEFQQRVKQAAIDRETMIKALQKDYDEKVAARNRFVADLEEKYRDASVGQRARQRKLMRGIDSNLEDLSRFLFARYMGGFEAKDMRYDAEGENLYFTLVSKNGTYKNMVMAHIPPDEARLIKQQGSYEITPSLEYDNQTLYVKGFEIKESDGSNYDVVYTNKSYEPTEVVVSIANEDESIALNKQVNFDQYKQIPTDLIAYDKREVWSIDVVSRSDARVPKWFETLQSSSGRLYGFGIGNTLDGAYDVARASLMRNMQSDISVTSTLKQETTSDSRFYSEYNRYINVDSKAKLAQGDYKEYKKEKVDGVWYVALEYLSETQ